MTKVPIVCSVSVSFSIFRLRVQQQTCTTGINNNIDDPGPGTLSSIFANQFICINRVKLRIFVWKVASSGPHLNFL